MTKMIAIHEHFFHNVYAKLRSLLGLGLGLGLGVRFYVLGLGYSG